MQSAQFLPSLPPTVALQMLQTLRTSLPPPVTDTEEARAARDETAIAELAALHPSDILEARLAADIVVADAHAMDSFRLAGLPDQNLDTIRRCRAQAASMLRLMQGGLRALQRTQADREKAEAALHPVAMERAGYWFRDVSVPDAASPTPEPIDDEPVIDLAAEAERYAVIYPDRAARIRAAGGLPRRVDFGRPDADLVAAIVKGTTPALLAADKPPGPTPPGTGCGVSSDGARSPITRHETDVRDGQAAPGSPLSRG